MAMRLPTNPQIPVISMRIENVAPKKENPPDRRAASLTKTRSFVRSGVGKTSTIVLL
jgi:hypothetical protein